MNIEMVLNKDNSENIKFLLVRLRDTYYGINIKYVDNMVKIQEMAEMPKSKQYCKGVINLRGNVIPVISINAKMGYEEDKYANSTRIVILRSNDSTSVGIIMSEVMEVITIKSSCIEKIADDVSAERNELCNGIFTNDNKTIFELDINKILLLDIY